MLHAQVPEEKPMLPYGGSLIRDTVPDISFDADSTLKFKRKKKKKKMKKNLFYGKKTRKGYTHEGMEEKQTVELFYVLKKNEEPSSYINDIYVWDMMKGKVVKVHKEELAKMEKYKILHGPYTKYIAGRMMETGIFYVGAKHGRWEKYKWEKKWWEPPLPKYSREENLQPILTGKAKYYHGFQREAQITYYDFDRKKVKEVVPSEYGEKTGEYYFFLENGQLLIKGYFSEGKKTGLWIEYFPDKNKRKREVQYPKDQWEVKDPIVMKEWDAKGNLIVINGEKQDPNSKKVEKDPIKKALKKKK